MSAEISGATSIIVILIKAESIISNDEMVKMLPIDLQSPKLTVDLSAQR